MVGAIGGGGVGGPARVGTGIGDVGTIGVGGVAGNAPHKGGAFGALGGVAIMSVHPIAHPALKPAYGGPLSSSSSSSLGRRPDGPSRLGGDGESSSRSLR